MISVSGKLLWGLNNCAGNVKFCKSRLILLALLWTAGMTAAESDDLWAAELRATTPVATSAAEFKVSPQQPEIRPIFYDGAVYRGKPTKVFAWYGKPKNATGKLPAILLVHGGGGTAFRYWTDMWVKRGYAVLAMDTVGGVPVNNGDKGSDGSVHHPAGGAPFDGCFRDVELPTQEQWMYHAVAAVIRGNTYLRSLPEVDADRIGLVGVSWGSVIGANVVGVDPRIQFAVLIYGGGFLGESSVWAIRELQQLTPVQAKRWVTLWDPGVRFGRARIPVIFINGALDAFFYPDSWWKTVHQVAPELRTASYRPFLWHGHSATGEPKEAAIFAASIAQGAPPMARITEQHPERIRFTAVVPLKKAELAWTADSGRWPSRRWNTVPARLDAKAGTVSADIPSQAKAWFFMLTDNRDCVVSSELIQRP